MRWIFAIIVLIVTFYQGVQAGFRNGYIAARSDIKNGYIYP